MTTSTMRALMVTAVALLSTLVGGSATVAVDAPAVTGRITFEDAGVDGAGIEILSAGSLVASTTTGATGAYEVAVPAPGVFDVRVTPPAALGVMAQTVRGVNVADASALAVVNVALRRPLGSLRVQVEDSTSAGLAGLQVRLVGVAPAPISVVDVDVTDASGGVEFRAPVGVDYQLRIDRTSSASSVVPASFELKVVERVQATSAGTDVTLQVPTATLDVTTTRSGPAPVGNVRLIASGGLSVSLGGGFTGQGQWASVGTTDAAGTASLAAVRGSVSITARPSDPLLAEASTSAVVAASPTAASILLPAAPTTTFEATVLDAAGTPVPNAEVYGTTSATTNASGVATALVRTDRVTPVGANATADASPGLDLPDSLNFRRDSLAGPTATLQAPLADLDVQVVDQVTGMPFAGALVTVDSPRIPIGDWSVLSRADLRVTDTDGRVTFRLVPGGTYRITASTGTLRYGLDSVDLAPGGSSTTIQLAPPPPPPAPGFVAITGRIVTPSGFGIAGLSVQSLLGGTVGTTDSTGSFSIRVSAVAAHGLQIAGTRLRSANGFDAPVPDKLDIRTAPVATIGGSLEDVAVGDVVLPLDELDVRVTDETGGGLFLLAVTSPLKRTSATLLVDGAPVAASLGSGYVDSALVLDELGEGTMYLFGGTHDVTITEGSLRNFDDIDLPVTEQARLTAGADTLLVVLTRRFGTPVTTLSGSPLVSSAPLTLELPDAQLAPIVELPEPLLGGSVSTSVILADRWFCGERREIVTDRDTCDELSDIDLIENHIADILGPGTYPLLVRSFVAANVPGTGFVFIQEGFRRSTLVLVAPPDAPPVLDRIDTAGPAPEGSLTLLTATASDAEGPVVVAWDLDSDGVGDAEGESVWIDVPDGPSFTSIGAIVTDSAGRSVRGTVEVESVNVAPTARLSATGPDDGGRVTVAVSDVDDPSDLDRAALVVELDLDGDGTYETPGRSAEIDASGFAADTYPVGARVRDKDGGVAVLTASFTIAAEPPTTPPTTAPTTPPTTPSTPAPTPPPTTPVSPTVTTATVPPAAPPAATPPPTVPIDPLDTQLPATGSETIDLIAVALGLLVIGAAFAATGRRRGRNVPPQGLEP